MKPGESPSLRRSSSTNCYRNITSARTSDSSTTSRRILPSSAASTSTSSSTPTPSTDKSLTILPSRSTTSSSPVVLSLTHRLSTSTRSLLSALLRSLTSTLPTTTRRRLSLSTNHTTPSLGRKITGTLFGHRKDHVTFAVQDTPNSDPVLLIELATSTSSLVKEMTSGLVRLALECRKSHGNSTKQLYGEQVWTMYCNGKKCGYATARACADSDRYVLDTIRSVSVGAGVIPPMAMDNGGDEKSGGEMLYMRARFERVVGSRDSEAFYMLNPDGNGGPDLSIFLLRL